MTPLLVSTYAAVKLLQGTPLLMDMLIASGVVQVGEVVMEVSSVFVVRTSVTVYWRSPLRRA